MTNGTAARQSFGRELSERFVLMCILSCGVLVAYHCLHATCMLLNYCHVLLCTDIFTWFTVFHARLQISDELNVRLPSGSRSPGSGGRPASQQQRTPLMQFPVILHLLTSPYFRSTVVTPQLISDLAG